ncbi:uncharacterized protein L199_005534 [Kwoniella botswanensis]|uniref:uncharacterized protein n=1 Tax=Kwoniella botswanensis TaxID=1268659 RepID=UPI00315DF8A6
MERGESSGTQHQGNGSATDTRNTDTERSRADSQTAYARNVTPSQLEQGQGSSAAGTAGTAGTTANTKTSRCCNPLKWGRNIRESIGNIQREIKLERERDWERTRERRIEEATEDLFDEE